MFKNQTVRIGISKKINLILISFVVLLIAHWISLSYNETQKNWAGIGRIHLDFP